MTMALSELNFRDVGDLPTGEGGRVRPGRLYRSEGPASFTPAHHQELRALGVRLVCDLRSSGESDKDPHAWSDSARILNLDIVADFRVATNVGWATLRDNPTSEAVRQSLLVNYEAMPAAMLPHMKTLIEAVVEGETPLLINCTAGKDRTGVMVALLLLALGVSEDAVVADYERSEIYGQNLRRRGGIHEQFEQAFGFRPSEAIIDAMTGVDVVFLRAALSVVTRDHGSVAGFFAAAGVSNDLMSRFRTAMIAA